MDDEMEGKECKRNPIKIKNMLGKGLMKRCRKEEMCKKKCQDLIGIDSKKFLILSHNL